MRKYTYHQNNSGGYWVGPKEIVVYADSDEEADNKAIEQGVYFDGLENGLDCDCCGPRWYRAYGPDNDD